MPIISKKLPSQELLNELLRYEPDTGHLYWRERSPVHFIRSGPSGVRGIVHLVENWNKQFAGKRAFNNAINKYGYLRGSLLNERYRTHRIIWKLVTGEEPDIVDHINGITYDNRWVNLRNVTQQQNVTNRSKSSNCSSGVTGVYWHKRKKRWYARITVNGDTKHLGYSVSKEGAIALRLKAELKYF